MYRISKEEWLSNTTLDLSDKTKSLKGGKGFKGSYIPANTMLTLLRETYPLAYPKLVEIQNLEEGCGVLLHVVLVWPDGESPVMIYPVMQHGTGRHAAKAEPDARDISDSLNRAFAKLIALETGLGWLMYLGEADPEDTKTGEEPTKRRRRSKPEVDEDDDEDEFNFDEEDDEDEEEDEEPKKTSRGNTRFRRRRH
jgi:hypothetical protein